jgi:hypothetical protein
MHIRTTGGGKYRMGACNTTQNDRNTEEEELIFGNGA